MQNAISVSKRSKMMAAAQRGLDDAPWGHFALSGRVCTSMSLHRGRRAMGEHVAEPAAVIPAGVHFRHVIAWFRLAYLLKASVSRMLLRPLCARRKSSHIPGASREVFVLSLAWSDKMHALLLLHLSHVPENSHNQLGCQGAKTTTRPLYTRPISSLGNGIHDIPKNLQLYP